MGSAPALTASQGPHTTDKRQAMFMAPQHGSMPMEAASAGLGFGIAPHPMSMSCGHGRQQGPHFALRDESALQEPHVTLHGQCSCTNGHSSLGVLPNRAYGQDSGTEVRGFGLGLSDTQTGFACLTFVYIVWAVLQLGYIYILLLVLMAVMVLLLLWIMQLLACLSCKRRRIQQQQVQAEKSVEHARIVSADLAKEKEASSKLQVQLKSALDEAEKSREQAKRAREERDEYGKSFTALTTEIARLQVELRKSNSQARPAADVGVAAGGDPKRRRSA